ncbi:MAG: hypothetical protein IPJ00_19110 [Saprospirales bacterium]|nr:hypothetical protein [Saprospirales bacterium]
MTIYPSPLLNEDFIRTRDLDRGYRARGASQRRRPYIVKSMTELRPGSEKPHRVSQLLPRRRHPPNPSGWNGRKRKPPGAAPSVCGAEDLQRII